MLKFDHEETGVANGHDDCLDFCRSITREEDNDIIYGDMTMLKIEVFVNSLQTCLASYHREYAVSTNKDDHVAPGPFFCPCSSRCRQWRHDNRMDQFFDECPHHGGFSSLHHLLEHLAGRGRYSERQFACPYHFSAYAFLMYMFASTFPRWDWPLCYSVQLSPDPYLGRDDQRPTQKKCARTVTVKSPVHLLSHDPTKPTQRPQLLVRHPSLSPNPEQPGTNNTRETHPSWGDGARRPPKNPPYLGVTAEEFNASKKQTHSNTTQAETNEANTMQRTHVAGRLIPIPTVISDNDKDGMPPEGKDNEEKIVFSCDAPPY